MIEINKIYNENNITTMSKIPNGLINGIICSPPYNLCYKRKDIYYNNGYSIMITYQKKNILK